MPKKKKRSPFNTKARKGYVDVHVLVSVTGNGETHVIHPSESHSMNEAIGDAGIGVGDIEEFHHAVLTLPIPKQPKVKKVKAKKITKTEPKTAKKKAVKKKSVKKKWPKKKGSKTSTKRASRVRHAEAMSQPAELDTPGLEEADPTAN